MPTVFDQPNSSFSNSGTLSGGATIAAAGFTLMNTDSGRIYGNGVTFSVGGSTLINELGGVVGDGGSVATLVVGSDASDTVINAGLINGSIALGLGADTYIDRSHSSGAIDLGPGNDTYRVESAQATFINATGGEGLDQLVFAATGGQYWSGSTTGFEALVFLNGGNFEGFSGYQSITIGPLSSSWSFVNLLNSLNPLADVAMSGAWFILRNSSVRSVMGSDASEALELSLGGIVTNGVSLGAGDDSVTLYSILEGTAPAFTSSVDGGAGVDTVRLRWSGAGDRSYDLTLAQGFETLDLNSDYIVDASTARVSNAADMTAVNVGQNVTLVLSNSLLPDARVGGGFGGGITLEAGTVIDRYGFPENGPWNGSIDIAQGNPLYSTDFLNNGTIENDVRLYIGDDLFDGRNGTTGGVIYGNAGNDTLLGGSGAERMQGGFGADILQGNGGFDTLTGDAGYDTFLDSKAGHNGDTITDFSRGDRIVFNDATLADFNFSISGNQLAWSGGSMTLAGLLNPALSVTAAAEGGVQIAFKVPPLIVSAGPPVSAPSQASAAATEWPNSGKVVSSSAAAFLEQWHHPDAGGPFHVGLGATEDLFGLT